MNKYSASRRDPVTELVTQNAVIADTMYEALAWFETNLGGEPTQLYTAELNVNSASLAQVDFSFVIAPADVTGGAMVYPAANSVPIGSSVLFTAILPSGATAVEYRDALGTVLANTPVASIRLLVDTVITMVFS